MSWAPLLLIEQNHISATRASSQWKAWHIGLKQHLFFFFSSKLSNISQILRRYWGVQLTALNTVFSCNLLKALNKSFHSSVLCFPEDSGWETKTFGVKQPQITNFIACLTPWCLECQWLCTFYSSWTVIFKWVTQSFFFTILEWWSICYLSEKDLIVDFNSTKGYLH